MKKYRLFVVTLVVIAVMFVTGAYLLQRYNVKENKHTKEDAEDILPGYEHYELEYYSIYNEDWENNKYNYDEEINKYSVPLITTVEQLRNDFDFNVANEYPVSIASSEIELNNDEFILAYVSCLDNYVADRVRFVYDEINTDNEIVIRTHFKIIEEIPSSAARVKLIVLTIIPLSQFQDLSYDYEKFYNE